MSPTLLATKFFIPSPRPELVVRQAAIERFGRGLALPVTLISAPAGAGKTTLVVEWASRYQQAATPGGPERSLAWLSLEPADSDPVRFWSYVLATLAGGPAAHAAPDNPFAALSAALSAGQSGDLSPVIDDLINLVSARPRSFILVLDDYQAIRGVTVHEGLTYLIDHQPANLHLVILTRSDPPLPIARLRGRGRLAEFRAADLRFNPAETGELISKLAGVTLPPDEAAALAAGAEGWAAGLQMAGLALRSQMASAAAPDTRAWIASFSGKHIYILDYLAEEVFNGQPPAVQDFLLKTALLNRMCAELCDAILHDETTPHPPAAETLAYLERANLFLVPLDGERTWYRYHHLFADLLRARLAQVHPGAAPRLHRRASEWFEGSGAIYEAVEHALAAPDWERAAVLVERFWRLPVESGEVQTGQRWLKALPANLVQARPRLGIACCWVYWLTGQISRMAPHLEAAARGLAELEPGAAADRDFLQAQVVLLRSIVERQQGRFAPAISLAQKALRLAEALEGKLPPEAAALSRGIAAYHLAEAHRMGGEAAPAAAAFEQAIPLLGNRSLVAASTAFFLLCKIQQEQGALLKALGTAQEGLRFAAAQPNPRLPPCAVLHLAAAEVFCERGELEAAEQQLHQAEELGRGTVTVARYAAFLRVRLARGRSDLAACLGDLERAEQAIHRVEAPYLLPELKAVRARVWLESGRVDLAAAWAAQAGLGPTGALDSFSTLEVLTCARLLVAQGQPDAALPLLEHCLAAEEAAGRLGRVIEILLMRARTHEQRSQRGPALADLRRALGLGQPEGYLRIFQEEGEALDPLLRAAAEGLPASDPLAALIARILASPQAPPAGQPLVEPLSARELDVLRLLARGLSNAQIAGELYISEGTVKTHIHHLLAKLGASSRAQALVIARELKLL